MPIPDAERAAIQAEKVRDYLLNLGYPVGRAKAIWFHTLGYTRDCWFELADDLLAIARGCDDFDSESTAYGIKYKAPGILARPGRRPARVLTVWIAEGEDPPRLVTAFPDE